MMKLLPRLLAASAIALMANAYAEQAGEPPAHPPMSVGMERHADHAGFGPREALARTKAELKLTAAQETKWQAAEAASKTAWEARRQAHEKMRASFEAERQKDVLDLSKLDRDLTALREQGEQLRDAARDKWLAAYESLNTDQKRLVSQRIKQRMERLAKRHDGMKHRGDAGPSRDAGPQ